jgi:hypothetical protein
MASGYETIAVGPFATASGQSSIAIGNQGELFDDRRKLWGKNATRELQYWQSVEASGFHSMAIGARPRATGDYSIALGKPDLACLYFVGGGGGCKQGKIIIYNKSRH